MHWLLLAALAFDLGTIKTEPNLEKRSDLALGYANTALDHARDAFSTGDVTKMQASLTEVGDAVEFSYTSLDETGKDARRSPKFFKRAELKTSDILRRLDGLRDTLGFDNRPLVEKVHARVSAVHDELLRRIMTKNKKR